MAVPTISTNFERYFVDFQGTYSELDGASTVVEVYRVKKRTDPAGPIIAPGEIVKWTSDDYQLMIDEGVIPKLGQDLLSWSPVASSDFPAETMRCRSVDFQTETTGDLRVICTFNTLYSVKPSTVNNTPYWGMPSSMEWQGSARTMPAWRKSWTTAPPAGADTTTDIGGSSYDGKLQGVPLQVSQIRIRVKFTLDSSVTKMMDQYNAVASYIGKINSDTFLLFPAGSVICESITMGKIQHEYYELIFEFLWDEFKHHDQVPKTEPDGSVEIDSTGNAKEVYWQRVNRTSAPFNNIWNSDLQLKDLVETGHWF